MANFDICFPFLLANEDRTPPAYEIVSDPTRNDPGAKAISGINSAYFPAAFDQIAALPPSERGPAVKDFYLENFWNDWLARIDSDRIAAMILDASVNQGSKTAVKLAQIAAGSPENEQDGIWGPITVGRINAARDFVDSFITARKAKYQETPGPQAAWTARAEKLPAFA